MKKLLLKTQGLMCGMTAFAMALFIYGSGCNFFLHQPKVPAALRELD